MLVCLTLYVSQNDDHFDGGSLSHDANGSRVKKMEGKQKDLSFGE